MKTSRQFASQLLGVLLMSLALIAGCRRAPSGPAFNVPSLIGHKIGDIRPLLRASATPVAASNSAPASTQAGSETFASGDYVLEVDYLPRNGRITTMRFSPADAAKPIREADKPAMLQAGTLREDDARYALEWIEDPQQSERFAGVRIVPAPKTHTVLLRVAGGASLLSVSYHAPQSVSPGTSPGQPFMTIAPWEATFSAPTGTVVGIEAGPSAGAGRSAALGVPSVQIVVDGKVAMQSAPSLGVASCSLELD